MLFPDKLVLVITILELPNTCSVENDSPIDEGTFLTGQSQSTENNKKFRKTVKKIVDIIQIYIKDTKWCLLL